MVPRWRLGGCRTDGVDAETLNEEPRTGLQSLRTVCTGVGVAAGGMVREAGLLMILYLG